MIETADQIKDTMLRFGTLADSETLTRAFDFGKNAHEGQLRASGEAYYTHPVAVANLLAGMGLDLDTVITALLHDTVEDCDVLLDTIEAMFGSNVAQLVDGVTKLSRIGEQNRQSTAQAENFRKLLLAMSEDVRVLLVKLADRTHNMRTLSFIPKEEKRIRIARETMEIYVPLAERIGVTNIQNELEDYAFGVLNPEMQETIKNRLEYLITETELIIPTISVELQHVVERHEIECSVTGRIKTPYSIWRKMQHKKVTMDQLADIMAFRVLVPDVESCYRTLGAVHGAYPTVMGRFKDYISTPKRNGYQSLHTGVIGPENHKIEIQVRTPSMHQYAENGVAAHWSYKSKEEVNNYKKIKWINELVSILDDEIGADEFLEHTKMDLYRDQVFCFTPRGDLIALPRGATAVDFAFAVHTKIGIRCNGVSINGKIRQLATELENGDQVDIQTDENARPRAEWEAFVKTGRAKSGIRRFLRAERIVEFSRVGKAILQKTFRENGKPFRQSTIEKYLTALDVTKLEELFAQVGEGRIPALTIFETVHPDAAVAVKDKSSSKAAKPAKKKNVALKIKGDNSGTAITMGRCCHPLPGDDVVGIFTTGKGVTVHMIGCDTLSKFNDTPELWIDVEWEREGPKRVSGRLKTVLSNVPGSLAALTTVIGQQGGNISNIHLIDRNPDFFSFQLELDVKNVEHLRSIIGVLQANKHIESVERDING